nr:MAG TPA: hypothetical protein [Caudoviricetes sp.]
MSLLCQRVLSVPFSLGHLSFNIIMIFLVIHPCAG